MTLSTVSELVLDVLWNRIIRFMLSELPETLSMLTGGHPRLKRGDMSRLEMVLGGCRPGKCATIFDLDIRFLSLKTLK